MDVENWKAIIYFMGHSFIDLCVHIGRAASAYIAQRLSFLLFKLAAFWLRDILLDKHSTNDPAMLAHLTVETAELVMEEMFSSMVKVF